MTSKFTQGEILKTNFTAIGDPLTTDDVTEGYEAGSIWINTVSQDTFTAISTATGAAIWKNTTEASGGQATNQGELLYGTLLDYPGSASTSSGNIQYIRLRITAGTVITLMRTYITGGNNNNREIRMGIYDQTDPLDPDLGPNNKLAQTASAGTGGLNNSFLELAFEGGDVTIPVTGYYWLAIVMDNNSLKIAVTASLRADFVPKRTEFTSNNALPSTAGGLSNPAGSLGFVAAQEALA